MCVSFPRIFSITSYQCMETTPSLACANKCVFCWRHHKNPVGKVQSSLFVSGFSLLPRTHSSALNATLCCHPSLANGVQEWRWKADSPELIVTSALEKHYAMINQMKGVPGVKMDRWMEAFQVRKSVMARGCRPPPSRLSGSVDRGIWFGRGQVKHCALSLVGEPIMYPYINEFIQLLHDREISSFLVTNAQVEPLILPPPTPLPPSPFRPCTLRFVIDIRNQGSRCLFLLVPWMLVGNTVSGADPYAEARHAVVRVHRRCYEGQSQGCGSPPVFRLLGAVPRYDLLSCVVSCLSSS